jgi:hypothetical protein
MMPRDLCVAAARPLMAARRLSSAESGDDRLDRVRSPLAQWFGAASQVCSIKNGDDGSD